MIYKRSFIFVVPTTVLVTGTGDVILGCGRPVLCQPTTTLFILLVTISPKARHPAYNTQATQWASLLGDARKLGPETSWSKQALWEG